MNEPLHPGLDSPWQQLGTPGTERGLQLAGPDFPVWFVEQGRVDVFLLCAGIQGGSAARLPLFSVQAGQLLTLPPGGGAGDAHLAVLPAPDALWRCLARRELLDLLGQPQLRPAALAGLDQLAAHIAGGLPGQPAPPPQLDDSLPGDALLANVDALFEQLRRSAIEQAARNEAEELQRLHTKRALSRRAMSEALGGFAALFQSRWRAAPGASGPDLILNACQVLGEQQGIRFRAAPAPVDGRYSDPVKAIAQASGVRTRTVTLKGEWWLRDNGPLLAFAEPKCQPCALLPTRGGRYRLVDPATRAETSVTAAFAETLKPFAYTFYASLPAQPLGLADILRFILRGVRRELLLVAAIALASALLGMAIPLASGYLFDSVFPAAERAQMLQVVVILFIAGLVTLLLEATRALTMLRLEGRASSDLQAAVWDRVLKLPVPFFRSYTAGDLATRINGINEIRQALSGTVISTIISSTFASLNVLLLFHYSPRLALVALALLALAMAVNLGIGYASASVRRAVADANGKVAGMVFEYLGGVAKLRITGAEARAFANWAAGFGWQKRLALRAGGLANASSVFNAAFPVAANAVIFACIGWQAAGSDAARFSAGDFIAFSAAWTLFMHAALTLVKTGIDLLPISSTYARTKPILSTLPEVADNQPHPGALKGGIELSHLRFAYAADAPMILDDVSLSIAPGQFVALVGASGSGKSTLLRLLLGFERPTHGGVYYDGHSLDEVDVGAVRRQIGVVLQSGRLMSGDIYTNIIGANSLSLDDAWAAARACGLDRDIEAMPMGMHTLVSEGGGTLSGGQRQRLLIARAIVTKPRLLFFDEATSALDNQSQATVSASMQQLQATRVVIAHRLSTIMHADCIYVLDKGKIIQHGTYQELMDQGGLFAELAQRQMA